MPVISILVVIFAGYFAYFIWTSPVKIAKKNPQKNSIDGSVYAKALADSNADSDNDGLKNWEEKLWKTDILTADTDGDGTSDGDEVKDGRDPIKVGLETPRGSGRWSDALPKPENIALNSGASTISLTMTQQIAAQFANSYFALKGAAGGQSLNGDIQQKLADSLSLEIEKGAAAYSDQYTEKDIKINKFVGVKTYLSNLGDAFDKNFKDISAPETTFMAQVIQSGDPGQLAKFDPYISAYKSMIVFLKNQEVPPDYAAIHLAFLNSMNNTAVADENLKQILSDPARAVIGIKLYYREIAQAVQIINDLKTQVANDQITKEKLALDPTADDSFFNKYIFK